MEKRLEEEYRLRSESISSSTAQTNDKGSGNSSHRHRSSSASSFEAYGLYDFALPSKKTPFGDWSESRSRRTYVYLTEALNISFPDYDFSGMDPNSFERASVLEGVIASINGQLSEMNGVEAREPMLLNELNVAIEQLMEQKSTSPPGTKHGESKKGESKHGDSKKDREEDITATSSSSSKPTELQRLVQRGVSLQFTDSLWAIIDQCICLSECDVFSLPSSEEDEGPWSTNALWSFAFFFVNLKRQRFVFFSCSARSILSSASLVLNGPSESPTASASPSDETSYASSVQPSDQQVSGKGGAPAGPRSGASGVAAFLLPPIRQGALSASVAPAPIASGASATSSLPPMLPRNNRSRTNSLQGLDDLAALTSAGGTLGARDALGSLEGEEDDPTGAAFPDSDAEDDEQLDDDFEEEEEEEDENESLTPDSPKRSSNLHKRSNHELSLQLSPMVHRKKRKT
jgi:Maf1 regulator